MTNMDRLPQEIYDRIAFHFEDRPDSQQRLLPFGELPFDRPALATISRQWQYAIERQSFRQLNLKSTHLDNFRKIVVGRRRLLLGCIRYRIILPTYGQEAQGQFEQEHDRQLNDEAFTSALHGLFQILASWGQEDDAGDAYSIYFRLEDIYSPTDPEYRASNPDVGTHDTRLQPTSNPQTERRLIRARDLKEKRFQYSYLRLLRPAELPEVPEICSLTLCSERDSDCRRIAPQTAIEIAASLPKLQSVWWLGSDCEDRYPALRRLNRNGFIQTFEMLRLPTTLHTLCLLMPHGELSNQAWRCANLLPTGAPCDPLGNALRKATVGLQRLVRLDVHGTIDSALLWPGSLEVTARDPSHPASEPSWQSLEELNVTFDPTTPSGLWYFQSDDRADALDFPDITAPLLESQMPPGHGLSQEEDFEAAQFYSNFQNVKLSGQYPHYRFRVVPDEVLLTPLVEAFARACLQMPTLKTANLTTILTEVVNVEGQQSYPVAPWGIHYAAPGAALVSAFRTFTSAAETDTGQRRLILNIRDWQLDVDVHRLLRDIGRERYGGEMAERRIDLKFQTPGV